MAEKKRGKLLEKILLGAVIGGAIGSVVGATLRSKNKQEAITEEVPAKKSKIRELMRRLITRRKVSGLKELPNEMEKEAHDKK